MKRILALLRSRREADVFLLICVCLTATVGWFNQQFPSGHDTIGGICTAALADSLLHASDTMLPWARSMILESSYMGPPLFHYLLAGLAHPLTWTVAAKLTFTLLFVLASASAYCFTHEITKCRASSMAAALAYAFAPFYLIEVVFEGHWGIGAVYALTPVLFLTTERVLQDPKPGRVILAALSLALLISMSHPQALPLLVGPFWVLYVILRVWQQGRSRQQATATASLLVLFLGLSLTAFWWLPLLREARYFHSTYSSLDEAVFYSASFREALTLRPILCCAADSAFGASGGLATRFLQATPFLLAVFGLVFNPRNRYVWIFAALAVLSLALALDPSQYRSLFWLARSHLSLFHWIRTPSRFLVFTAFAYAVLIGFCVKAIVGWLTALHARRLIRQTAALTAVVLVALVVVGNTWCEAREGFSSFKLSPDRANALSYLTDQQDGEYRVADSCLETEAYSSGARITTNPTYWVFAHGKETEPGGMPQTSTWAAGTISYLRDSLASAKVNMSEWLSLFNVRYAVMDSDNALTANVVLDDRFAPVFTSDSVNIYENHQVLPRMFTMAYTDVRPVNLWNGSSIAAGLLDDDSAKLSLVTEHTRSDDRSLKMTCAFAEPQADSAILAIDLKSASLSDKDAIRLAFYSGSDLPDISLRLEAFERDGSRYGMELFRTDGIKAGWNEITFPLSLLVVRDSIDENDRLDASQIRTIAFGPTESSDSEVEHQFSLYFDQPSVVAQETSTNVECTNLRPGKYEVNVTVDSPSYLVLSESYHPFWVATGNSNRIQSQIIYESLNSFYLEPGEYELTVEFTTSSLRTAANVISAVAGLVVCSIVVFLLVMRRRRKRQIQRDSENSAQPAGSHGWRPL